MKCPHRLLMEFKFGRRSDGAPAPSTRMSCRSDGAPAPSTRMSCRSDGAPAPSTRMSCRSDGAPAPSPDRRTLRENLSRLLLAALCLSLPLAVSGQNADAADDTEVIPTEVSEPPYEEGDLVLEAGYYIERGEEQAKINLRIEGNKFRLYWIDSNGLIAEPEYSAAVIRLTGSIRGRPYHKLNLLPGGAGLGSSLLVVPPHIFNVVLVLIPEDADAEPVTYSFRYTAEFDTVTDPTAQLQY